MSHPVAGWMPFHGDDFLESENVSRMDSATRWTYLRLLWRQWKHGSLPADVTEIAATVPDCPGIQQAWAHLEPLFPICEDGRRRNPRCAAERAESVATLERAIASGRKGGLSRAARVAQATLEGSVKQASSSDGMGWDGMGENRRVQNTQNPPIRGVQGDTPSASEPSGSGKKSETRSKASSESFASRSDPHARVIQHFTALYQSAPPYGYGTKYPFTSSDAKTVQAMLKLANEDPEPVCRAMTSAFGDPWWLEKGITLRTIRDNYAKFTALRTAPTATKLTPTQIATQKVLEAEANGALFG